MKDKIFSAAKTRFAALGLDDDILMPFSELLANSIKEESEIEGALAGAEPMMKSWQKAADKIRESAAKTKNKKQTENNPQPPTPPTTPPKNEDENESEIIPAWAQTLIAEVKSLKSEKVTSQRKEVFDKLIENLPEAVRQSYSFINYSDMSDDDFTNLTSSVKENVEKVTKEIGVKGGLFKTPMDSKKTNDNARSDKEVKSIVAGMFKSNKK